MIIRDESEISEFSSQMDEQGTIVIIENLDRVSPTRTFSQFCPRTADSTLHNKSGVRQGKTPLLQTISLHLFTF